jgi:hypothetical protein
MVQYKHSRLVSPGLFKYNILYLILLIKITNNYLKVNKY